MHHNAAFRCFAGCPGRYLLTQPIYRCPTCGGLLDVAHDLDALRTRTPDAWKRLFEDRYRRGPWPLGSGVWGKREWVAPGIPDDAIVSTDEGGTSLLRADRYARSIGLDELWIKQCGASHTGSFKDLGMTVLVSVVHHAVRQGLRVRAVACASTGDTSAALAAYGAAAGLPVAVLLPRGKVSTAQLVQPIASGAIVLALDTDFDGCMAIVQRLAADGVVYLANSMNALRIEGQKTVAIEIAQQLGWTVPDWVVLPSGNLGNAYALYAGFRMLKDLGLTTRIPRLAVAQAERAAPLYRAWTTGQREVRPITAGDTLASAIRIGNPVSAPRAIKALDEMDGVVEEATEAELCDAAARADRTGLYTCPHTAVALAALEKLERRGVVRRGDRVVVISTASALKFTEFKVQYHERTLPEIESTWANPPITLPPDYDRVLDALERHAAAMT
ncbi:threonine synthase [Chondromyces apiculatus]|uniref:Threonine synthase n=1 Tax=Chondromyces apiculatus DSM 436 TaxID=1192034 RepID=A0A017TB30_9BACT|nr:threonine synthase [Chondromyces apiculatus]EYF06025.1 Threonine synthase [Chondromyces apiculatus DSM 436]